MDSGNPTPTVEKFGLRATPSTNRRLRWRVAALLLLPVALIAAGPLSVAFHVPARRESQRVLRGASVAELESVVEKGVVLHLPGGEWIAIRYTDSHAPFGDSYAVARTSDGDWLVSERHYCATFRAYGSWRDALERALAERASDDEVESARARMTESGAVEPLWRAEHAGSLQEAIEAIADCGFRRL